jgi:arsenite methyltransferase
MSDDLTPQERQQIEKGIRGKYVKVAVSPDGLFRYPTGRAGMRALQYDPQFIHALPGSVADAYCGVGNPFTLGPIHPGNNRSPDL